jgi:hypothetical protein
MGFPLIVTFMMTPVGAVFRSKLDPETRDRPDGYAIDASGAAASAAPGAIGRPSG